MNRAFKSSLIFIAGVIVGSVTTAIIVRDKYKKELEIETSNLISDFISHREKRTVKKEKAKEYSSIIQALGYEPDDGEYDPEDDYEDGDVSDLSEPPLVEDLYSDLDERKDSEPCAVSPDEFSELLDLGYSYTQWNIYNGKYNAQVICDENDMKIEQDEMDDVIGKAIYSIGEYDKDILYVRNDRLRCAIEVTRDNRSYEEILRVMPYLEI